MSFLDFITLGGVVILFVLSPGPGVVALIARTVSSGYTAGVWLGIGEILGDTLYLLAVVISLGALADIVLPYMGYVRVLGGLYLAYLGIKMFFAPPMQRETNMKLEGKAIAQSLFSGFIISGTNPKVIVFYLSLLPLFVDLTTLDTNTSIQLVGVVWISLFIAVQIIVLGSVQIAKWLDRPQFARMLNYITGLMMAGVGVWVAFG